MLKEAALWGTTILYNRSKVILIMNIVLHILPVKVNNVISAQYQNWFGGISISCPVFKYLEKPETW